MPNSFTNMEELSKEMKRLGEIHCIKEESINSPSVFMLTCQNQCDAKILGMLIQNDNTYCIKKTNLLHSCSIMNEESESNRENSILHEIQRKCINEDGNLQFRIGEIVERLYMKFKANYSEIFQVTFKNNLRNFNISCKNENGRNSISLNNENNIPFIDSERDSIINQKTEDFSMDCLQCIKEELTNLNPHIKCTVTRSSFFFMHKQMIEIFRKVHEIKIYPRMTGFIVLGLLFDSNDDFIIESCLISEEGKIRALEIFLEQHQSNFYIIDFDLEIIELFISKGISFFIKTRAIFHYLHESKDECINSWEYFYALNYSDKDLLEMGCSFSSNNSSNNNSSNNNNSNNTIINNTINSNNTINTKLHKSNYLKSCCPIKLYNLNNAHFPDFDFITSYILNLSLVDSAISMIWLVSDDMKTRKLASLDESDYPELIFNYFEELDFVNTAVEETVNLEEGHCTCGKFQDYLMPCVHAYKKIKEMGKDPMLYVSSVYSREKINKVNDIIPVVDIRVHKHKR